MLDLVTRINAVLSSRNLSYLSYTLAPTALVLNQHRPSALNNAARQATAVGIATIKTQKDSPLPALFALPLRNKNTPWV